MDGPGGQWAIGNTPVVRLARLGGGGCAEVWVKMEAANPAGSYKDRMALAMIEAAEADGSPVLDPPVRSRGHGNDQGNRRRQSRTPALSQKPRENP